LVIYYGEETWDGPMRLSDMMDIPSGFERFYNDYHIQLLEVHSTTGISFKHQDNFNLFTMLNDFYNSSKILNSKQFKKRYPDLTVWWEVLAAFGAITRSKKVMDYAHANEGSEVRMWAALERLKQEGIEEGIEKGIVSTIVNIMNNLKLSIEEAIIAAGVPESERDNYARTIRKLMK